MAGRRYVILLAMLVLIVSSRPLRAQYVNMSTPMIGISDSWYEHFGVNWGFESSGPNGQVFFNQGGFRSAIPPFGGFDPGASARFGWQAQKGGTRSWFNFVAGEGSTRSNVMQSPMLTLPNGIPASFSSIQQRPFVTSVVPLLPEKIARLQNEQLGPRAPASESSSGGSSGSVRPRPDTSSAASGDLSVAEILRQQSDRTGQDAEIDQLLAKGEACERDGKLGAARIYYRQAGRRAQGARQQALFQRADSLQKKG